MKYLYLLLILSLPIFLNAQVKSKRSDLRKKVEQIIKYEIKYKIDETTDKQPQIMSDSVNSIASENNPIASNPLTLIIINSQVVSIEELNNYVLAEVDNFNIYPKNHHFAMSIFGEAAKNGMIAIELK